MITLLGKMAFAGFGKHTGPSVNPKSTTPFGSFPSSNPNPDIYRSPSYAYGSSSSTSQSHQKQLTPARAERPAVPHTWENLRQSPIALSANTYDSIKPKRIGFMETNKSPPFSSGDEDILGLYSIPDANNRRMSTSPILDTRSREQNNLHSISNKRMSPVVTDTDAINAHSAKRARSPPFHSHVNDFVEVEVQSHRTGNGKRMSTSPFLDTLSTKQNNLHSISYKRMSPVVTDTDAVNAHGAKRAKSPSFHSHVNDFVEAETQNHRTRDGKRMSTSPILDTRSTKQNNLHSINNKRMSPVVTDTDAINVHDAKRDRSPSFHSHANDFVEVEIQNHRTGNSKRHEVSPPRLFNKNKAQVIATATESTPIYTDLNSSNRHRSPPLQSAKMEPMSSSDRLDYEREMQAKAKRLARFNVELRQPTQTPEELAKKKFPGNQLDQTIFVKQKFTDNPSEEYLCNMSGEVIPDNEGIEPSKVIVGQCSDMCPESERDERERKGDLDKYERLNGERNQTTKFIAVKKYTRTAERDAYLIRPLPILRMTVDYLLSLLDQPYNENFLGIYNFLWDRMRAVRMDLRMQHIFNEDAILMLEQMIRLHILAMHELCEYKKGEGFAEGFDAHLNIEQMNKTSVELFQLYDDHRKMGISVPAEKEFRGYYALLKLDKHPGYKVEPSELSLDLAKMTSEMRSTPEVLFARNVARACRTGNYIAFFRLARKATYLQACLMHAHFAKVRTQALASLHSGLQNNQGIPVSEIVNWLGLEEEDVESLLEFHGFALRKYEETYMVKEGSFLNSDSDYTTKCSQLVEQKKSKNIVDDVRYGPSSSEIKMERKKKTEANFADAKTSTSIRESWLNNVKESFDSKLDYTPKVNSTPQLTIEKPVEKIWNDSQEDHELSNASPIFSYVENSFEMIESSPDEVNYINDKTGYEQEQNVESIATASLNSINEAQDPANLDEDSLMETQFEENDTNEKLEEEASMVLAQQKEEAFGEKLKLIIRKWKEQSSVLRQIREKKEFLAKLALSSLSLGPPIRRQSGVRSSFVTDDFNLDHTITERLEKLEKSWASLNVGEITSQILSSRNPDSECIVWKLLLLAHANGTGSQTYNMALKWLRSKLMPSDIEPDDELLVSSPGLSIWTHSSPSQPSCLSVIKESNLREEGDCISGSCSLLFLASGHISWDMQKNQIQKLVNSIPLGASLPLLILVTDTNDEAVNIINQLGLHEADKEKICSISVIFLSSNSFFDDDKLIEGLQWLAKFSPLQPKLCAVNTRELIMSNLRNSITKFEDTNISVEPNHCISAFNDALNNSAEQIKAAASANRNNWPAPETNTIKKLNLNFDLPVVGLGSDEKVGLGSDEKVDRIVSTIKQCMLPFISNEMPWLNQASPHDQKLAIEDCLVNYLTRSGLMNYELAVREASIMLQNNASLELRGVRHHVVPRWFDIFQRIFNWQMMKLRGNEVSKAYVLENKMDCRVEEYRPSTYARSEMSLDELMDISCNVPFTEKKATSENLFTSREINLGTETSNAEKDEMEVRDNIEFSQYRSPVSSNSRSRLEMLFERCKIVQDSIDEKLSIYGCNL